MRVVAQGEEKICGLVSIIARRFGGFNYKSLDMLEHMLVFDTVRGKDSTGVMSIRLDANVDIIKQAEQPYYMFRTKAWDTFKGRAFQTGKILAGHNRAATRGNVTNENAHPFYEKNIVLMHNGTLDPGWEKLTKATVQVDSHAICHALTESDPHEVLPKINGAFALLWYDLDKQTFHAIRNEDRPLCLVTTDEFYYLASESWMATIPCMRNNIKVKDTVLMEPGDFYTWNLSGEMKVEKIKLSGGMGTRYNNWMANHDGRWEDDLGEPTPGGKGTQIGFLPGVTKDCSSSSTENKQTSSCALTSTSTTKKDSDEKNTDGTPSGDSLSSMERNQASLKIELADLPKGREVMVKIWDVKRLPNGAIKWTGKLQEPGVEMLDTCGFLPRETPGNEWAQWIESLISAKVNHITKTVCGPVVYVNEVTKLEQTMIHMGKLIPETLWTHARLSCKCSDCKQSVEDWEKDWTSVKLKGIFGNTKSGLPLNTVEMTCPDCIMRMLDGDIYARFTRSYYGKRKAIIEDHKGQPATSRSTTSSGNAIQDREPVGWPYGSKDGEPPRNASGETVQ